MPVIRLKLAQAKFPAIYLRGTGTGLLKRSPIEQGNNAKDIITLLKAGTKKAESLS